MGDALILYFYRIFDCFWKEGKILFIQNSYALRDTAYEAAVSFLFTKKDFHICCECFYIFINIVIWKKGYAILCQCILDFCRKCFFICEQKDLGFGHYQVRKNNRTAMHIAAADI